VVGTLFWFGVLAALPQPRTPPAETLIRLTVDPMPPRSRPSATCCCPS